MKKDENEFFDLPDLISDSPPEISQEFFERYFVGMPSNWAYAILKKFKGYKEVDTFSDYTTIFYNKKTNTTITVSLGSDDDFYGTEIVCYVSIKNEPPKKTFTDKLVEAISNKKNN